MTLATAILTSKARITLPKSVRQLLGVRGKSGDQVGFVIDEKTHYIFVTKVNLVPGKNLASERQR